MIFGRVLRDSFESSRCSQNPSAAAVPTSSPASMHHFAYLQIRLSKSRDLSCCLHNLSNSMCNSIQRAMGFVTSRAAMIRCNSGNLVEASFRHALMTLKICYPSDVRKQSRIWIHLLRCAGVGHWHHRTEGAGFHDCSSCFILLF